MNARDRFLAVMAFEPCDRTLLWGWAYWGGTVQRWYDEGLAETVGFPRRLTYGEPATGPGAYWGSPPMAAPRAYDVSRYFAFDADYQCVPLENWVFPFYPEVVLADEGENMVFRDKQGVIMRKRKDDSSLAEYLSWPVVDSRDWEQLREERLQPRFEERVPGNWDELVRAFRVRDYPLALGGYPGGYFGSLRYLMGEMRLFTAYYDGPALVHNICRFLTEFWIELYGRVLQEVQVDSFEIWEDMCYKAGPLISPAMFREFMAPYYKRLIGFLKENGVRNVIVDTDGDCTQLIPLFLEVGVTGLSPFEVQAGMDIRAVRERHPRLQIMGGIDKTMVAAGRQAIDKELDSKLPYMVQSGGYIPYLDHLVPPDVSWDNFVYYRERLAQLVGHHRSGSGSK